MIYKCKILLNKKRSSSRFPFKIGQYCTLQDDIAVKDDSKKLRVPVSREFWKIVDILKNGFLIKILNVRSLAEKSVVHSRIEHLSLQDIQAVHLNLPDLYDNLVRLQRENRNTYKPAQRVQTGCYQIPYIGEQRK